MWTSPLVLVFAFVSASLFLAAGDTVVTVDVNLKASDAYVDELFLSLSMPHKISKWESMPLSNSSFRELFKALAPASLRTPCNPQFHRSGSRKKRSDKVPAYSDSIDKFTKAKHRVNEKAAVSDNISVDDFKDPGGKLINDGIHDDVKSGHNSSGPPSSAGEKTKHQVARREKIPADTSTTDEQEDVKEDKDMSVKSWERLYEFIQFVGWNITMDLVNLDRTSDGRWDSTGAKFFLKYAAEHNMKIPDFKLGNEPNRYPAKYNIHGITPERTVQDFKDLRNLLREHSLYKHSTLVGPDTTRPSSSKHFFTGFLDNGGCNVVDEISFHHYYRNRNKHNPTVHDFLNISTMILLEEEFDLARDFMKQYNCRRRLRLTETSSISAGLHDVADRFVAGYLWLDKLGVAARNGVIRLYRFNLWGGSYSLLDRETSEPNPDYYLTLLYKRLVEGNVFNVTTDNNNIRAYANCARHLLYPKGSLVIYLLNVLAEPVKLNLKQFPIANVDTYIFTAGDSTGVLAKSVKVNDILMTHTLGRNVPFKPRPAQGSGILLPSHSFGFIVVPKANLNACIEMKPPPRDTYVGAEFDSGSTSAANFLALSNLLWISLVFLARFDI